MLHHGEKLLNNIFSQNSFMHQALVFLLLRKYDYYLRCTEKETEDEQLGNKGHPSKGTQSGSEAHVILTSMTHGFPRL